MNSLRNALAIALLLGTSTSTFAASTIHLTVKGLITPSACTPALSAAGTVDYGKLSVNDLHPTYSTDLPQVTLNLQIACAATTPMAFKLIDNRPGTHTIGANMGLGLTDAGEKIGSAWLYFQNPVADGTPADVSVSLTNGSSWIRAINLDTRGLYAPSAAADFSVPIAIKHFATELQVGGVIAPTSSMTLTREVVIDGNATVEVLYL